MYSQRRIVVALFIAFGILRLFNPTYAQTEHAPQISTDIVLSTTVVNGKGELAGGLQKENFQVFIDNKPEGIVAFAEFNEPVSIGILFDASGSMGNEKTADRRMVDAWQRAFRAFLENSNRSNEYFLMAFNNKPQLLADWTTDGNVIVDALSGLRPLGNTALYDACYLALDKVQRGRHARHVLILITDGYDTNSTYYFDQLKEVLRKSDVLIYSINFDREDSAGSHMGTEGLERLKELSMNSGGEFFFKKIRFLTSSETVPVFELIATELNHQYKVGISPALSTADNKWHKVKVKVTVPGKSPGKMKSWEARTRAGIYLNPR